MPAQTQKGYVKTRGRLGANGKTIIGNRLSGVSVVPNIGNPVVSNANGSFTLALPATKFHLQKVKKNGYVLIDPDILSHQYTCSTEPLVLVLESLQDLEEEKFETEQKIRNTLQRQLQQKQKEIDQLKRENKLTMEEYRREINSLNKSQDMNTQLIKDMVERYTSMDFDKEDQFSRKVASLILKGDLIAADSLLRTKGDPRTQAVLLRQKKDYIEKQKSDIEKAEKVIAKDNEDIAQRNFYHFEVCKLQHQNDSAATYIEARADLDSTRVSWQLDAGLFAVQYLSNYERGQAYFRRALRNAISQHGENHPLTLLLPHWARSIAMWLISMITWD